MGQPQEHLHASSVLREVIAKPFRLPRGWHADQEHISPSVGPLHASVVRLEPSPVYPRPPSALPVTLGNSNPVQGLPGASPVVYLNSAARGTTSVPSVELI